MASKYVGVFEDQILQTLNRHQDADNIDGKWSWLKDTIKTTALGHEGKERIVEKTAAYEQY